MRIFGLYYAHGLLHLASPLVPGDTIAVVAPSSAPRKPGRLARGLAALTEAGFVVDWDPDRLRPRGYLANTDTRRARMFNSALGHRHVKAILCVRGGYGALRILDRVDFAAARRSPKLLMGFSDITALQLALYRHAGWRSLSGPVLVDLAESSAKMQARFWALAAGAQPPPMASLDTLRPGTARGPLLGGNLSMVARLVGTPYLPNLSGAILVLEEVNEAPYRIDALLAQLRLAGILGNLAGLILGAFTGWKPRHSHGTLTPAEIFDDYFGGAPYPVATGLRYGHFAARETLVLGAMASLDAAPQGAALTMLEPACG